MGPLENADYVGLDLTLAIHQTVLPALAADPRAEPAAGRPGAPWPTRARSGRGFLPWPPGAREDAARGLAAPSGADPEPGRPVR